MYGASQFSHTIPRDGDTWYDSRLPWWILSLKTCLQKTLTFKPHHRVPISQPRQLLRRTLADSVAVKVLPRPTCCKPKQRTPAANRRQERRSEWSPSANDPYLDTPKSACKLSLGLVWPRLQKVTTPSPAVFAFYFGEKLHRRNVYQYSLLLTWMKCRSTPQYHWVHYELLQSQ